MPVVAPEEPQLALARGAALASANAPRYDASTVGLAYSQDPDGTTAQTMATLLGHDGASPDAADTASDPDDVPERRKPFLLVGGSLAAVFVAGLTALAITLAVNIQPTADQGSDDLPGHPGAAAPPPPRQSAPPAAPPQVPNSVPDPAQAAPPSAATVTARLMVPPAPPPPVLVRNAAPAPAAPAPAAPPPAPAAPPGSAGDHPVAPTDSSATRLQPVAAKPALGPGSEGAEV